MFEFHTLPLLTWLRQSFTTPPPPTASFAGQTILITGASGAILSTAARIFLTLGAARLIFAVPDIPPEAPSEHLLRLLGPEHYPRRADSVEVWNLDLLSFASVRAVAARAAELDRLDVALMGAAVIKMTREVGPDGWEATLQVNHLSCALLGLLLLPVLERSAAASRGSGGGKRGVLAVVSSMSVWTAASTIPPPPKSRSAGGETPLLRAVDAVGGYAQQRQQYGTTKLLQLYWLRELMERRAKAEKEGVVIQACDFGVSKGKTGIATLNWEAKMFSSVFGRSPEICAQVTVNACTPQGDARQGGLLLDYDFIPYPTFMGTERGKRTQETVWVETKKVLLEACPEAQALYDELGAATT